MLIFTIVIVILLLIGSNSANNNNEVKNITVKMLPSCSIKNHDNYYLHSETFKNYCPNCNSNDTLLINPKMTYEGEITCSHCDSDYCGVCGKEKMSHSNVYLKKV